MNVVPVLVVVVVLICGAYLWFVRGLPQTYNNNYNNNVITIGM